MTDDPSAKAGTEGARILLVESETVLEDLLAGFRDYSGRLARGDDVTEAEVSRSRVALASMTTTILEEVRRHEARVFDTEGLAEAAPIDLDDARASIGRRLDRIRNARGAG